MSHLQVDLHALGTPVSRDSVSSALEHFISDMKAGKSGFYALPKQNSFPSEILERKAVLASRMGRVETFIHLGIGGSSLGAEAIVRALAPTNAPAFYFLDNIDPDALCDVMTVADPATTLIYVVSKSGNTLETIAQFEVLYAWLEKKLGAIEAQKRLVFCTDPKRGSLRDLAKQWSIPTFEIPPNLGGRYSVLSAVGLFPAMVAGLDYHPFLTGAQEVVSHFEDQVNAKVVPDALELAARLVQFYKKDGRNITVLMPYSQKLKTFSAWFVQLWAEGLGKNGLGITPVAATGPTDQHSLLQILRDGPNDKTVGFIEVLGFQNLTELKWTGVTGGTFDLVSGITLNQLMDAELNATRQVLSNQSRPHFSLCIPKLNPTTLGQLFQFLALTTALAGYLLEIDPFDQPGVEEGKVLAIDRINACKKNAIV